MRSTIRTAINANIVYMKMILIVAPTVSILILRNIIAAVLFLGLHTMLSGLIMHTIYQLLKINPLSLHAEDVFKRNIITLISMLSCVIVLTWLMLHYHINQLLTF